MVGYTQLCHFLKVLHHKMDKMKIFLASRVLGRFEPYFVLFAHTRKFQITRLLSITYLKNGLRQLLDSGFLGEKGALVGLCKATFWGNISYVAPQCNLH